MISLKPSHLKRYKDIGWLLVKYGFSDIVQGSQLSSSLLDGNDTDGRTVDGQANPEELASDLEQLGPTFVKLGQVLSSRADLLPQPYLDALSRLQDDVSTVPFEQIEGAILEELGKRTDVVFQTFDTTPLAAASLGQVHRATLHNGDHVAVKIQRPGIRMQIAEDIEVLAELATQLEAHTETARKYEFSRIVAELAGRLRDELNYSNELQNAERLRKSLAEFSTIHIPKIHERLSTDRILTMEYVSGRKITELSDDELQRLNAPAIANDLFRCYLHQLLVDGCFHSDPHAGNLAVTPEGRIALLDFGLATTVDPEMRNHLIKILMNISEGQGDLVAQEVLAISSQSNTASPSRFREQIVALVGRHHGKSVRELQAGRIVLDIQRIAAETGISIRSELQMLGKTLIQLDESIRILDPKFDPNQMIRDNLQEVIQKRGSQKSTLLELYNAFTETSELVKRMPERLNHFSKLLARNEVRVKVDAIDEAAFLRSIHKIANRITTGLVLAALIIGASLMMRMQTSLTIFGYPLIAMFFFLTAAVSGLVLAYKATFQDDRDIQ